MLLSLIAPGPVLLQTGDQDGWSDPKGEFLAAVAAEPVFKLLGKQGLGTIEMPEAGKPILNSLGYYIMQAGTVQCQQTILYFLILYRGILLKENKVISLVS